MVVTRSLTWYARKAQELDDVWVTAARELGHQAQQVLLLLGGQLVPELAHSNGVDPPAQCFEHLWGQGAGDRGHI